MSISELRVLGARHAKVPPFRAITVSALLGRDIQHAFIGVFRAVRRGLGTFQTIGRPLRATIVGTLCQHAAWRRDMTPAAAGRSLGGCRGLGLLLLLCLFLSASRVGRGSSGMRQRSPC